MRPPKPQPERMKAPSYRVLVVMDLIGEYGPISLNRLCEHLPDVSRAGVWRAAATLRDYGWVRTRLADNAFELTSRLDFKLSNAHFAHEAAEFAVCEIQRALEQGVTNVSIGAFTAPGRFEVIESTQADVQIGQPLSLVFDELALAAQSQMDQLDLLKHLTTYLAQPDLSEAEGEAIRSGAHAKHLRAWVDTSAGHWVSCGIGSVFLSPKWAH